MEAINEDPEHDRPHHPERNGQKAEKRKRKLEGLENLREPATKKSRGILQRPGRDIAGATSKKPRATKQNLARGPSEDGKNILSPKDAEVYRCPAASRKTKVAEPRSNSLRVDAEAIGKHEDTDAVPKMCERSAKPNEAKGKIPRSTKIAQEPVGLDFENTGGLSKQQMDDTAEVAQAVAPARKRKKRRSIGQQSMKRVKPSAKREPPSHPKSSHETSDLVNELLESTIEVVPEKSRTRPVVPRNHAGVPKSEMSEVVQDPPVQVGDVVSECQDSTTLVDSTTAPGLPETTKQLPTSSKPRRKRRPLTQVRRPRKQANASKDAQEEVVKPKSDGEPEGFHLGVQLAEGSEPDSGLQPRKPLSNITNVAPAVIGQRKNLGSTEGSSQVSAPTKKRGRPRKDPTTDASQVLKPRDTATKRARKPKKTANAQKIRSVDKLTTAAPKSNVPPKESNQVSHDAPTQSLPNDLDDDSDDPLSGATTIRPNKPTVARTCLPLGTLPTKPTKQISTQDFHFDGLTGKIPSPRQDLQPKQRPLTPKKKRQAEEKQKETEQKETEQKEIEELLGSIKKAVQRGREISAAEKT